MSTLSMWLFASSANAMCPYPTPKVCSEFFVSDAVFVGTVLSQRWGDEYIRFRVRVSRVLRGQVARVVTVYTGNDSARLQWEVGRTYVAFAARRNGRLESGSGCGPLDDSNRVAETVRQIEGLRGAKGAIVEGVVGDAEAGGKPVPGVRLSLVGGANTIQLRSDGAGQFRAAVAPGRYRLRVDPEVAFQSVYNLGMVDLSNIVLTAGQCAQVQLVAR